MFCSVAMQNYFPETRGGRPVSMKTREGEREWWEVKRGRGVTLEGSMVNQKVRVEVRCGLWVEQSEEGVPLRVKDDTHCAVLSGGSPQVTQHRNFVTSSESSGSSQASSCARCIYIRSIMTQLHTFGLIMVVFRPAQLSAYNRLDFFWVS